MRRESALTSGGQRRNVDGLYMALSGRNGRERDKEGGPMGPAIVGNLRAPLPALLSRPNAELAPPARRVGVPASLPSLTPDLGFQLRCADVLPVCCDVSWRSARRDDLVPLACAHGAIVHGFTPVWYSRKRIDGMKAAVVG